MLPIYYIVLSVEAREEEGDAEVGKVEGDACTRVGPDGLPKCAVAGQVEDDEEGVVVDVAVPVVSERWRVVRCLGRLGAQEEHIGRSCGQGSVDNGMAASFVEAVPFGGCEAGSGNVLRLAVVGQTEKEPMDGARAQMQQLHMARLQAVEQGIGIVGARVVKDLCHQIVGEGRMNAVAAAMADAAKPCQGIAYEVHF